MRFVFYVSFLDLIYLVILFLLYFTEVFVHSRLNMKGWNKNGFSITGSLRSTGLEVVNWVDMCPWPCGLLVPWGET